MSIFRSRATALFSLGPLAICAAACGFLFLFALGGAHPALRQLLGLTASYPTLPRQQLITISPADRGLDPPAVALGVGGTVSFANQSTRPVLIRSDQLAPAPFSLFLAPRSRRSIQLHRPGLYHYYDARTGRPTREVSGNLVIVATRKGVPTREGWIAVLSGVPSLRSELVVPSGQYVFTPKVVVALAGSTIEVRNDDEYRHNFVTDPASPIGGAFIVSGMNDEHGTGWQRVLVPQQPGLYHVYCTLHTTVLGRADGWRVVAPRRATGYSYVANDPMEAWIIVLPATTRA